ncbi:MAG: hypothetical protein JST58_08780 [Bacteroidetes bacterium]|nr:hypothetical protein [Bacteroidota bacterium]
MKKRSITGYVLIVIFFNLMSVASIAQSHRSSGPVTPVRVGSLLFNAGLGVGANYQGDYYNTPFGTKLALEWGLWHAGPGTITLGPEVGGSFSNGGYYNDYRASTIVVAMRSAWHYGWKVPGLDTYGGLSAGIGFHHYNYRNNTDYVYNQAIPVLGGFIGASYFISPTFGFNAEAGSDITNFQVGIVVKLK